MMKPVFSSLWGVLRAGERHTRCQERVGSVHCRGSRKINSGMRSDPALRDFGLAEQELGTVGDAFTEMVSNTIDHSRSGTWL
jgi:hypothetical protein